MNDHENLFLMLGGHISGEGRRQDTGINGNVINTLLSDYQDYPNGGNGFLRIMTFSPTNNTIQVQTYSPVLDQFETDDSSQFTLSYNMQDGPPFEVIGTANNVPSGANASVPWPGLDDNSEYEWYVTVDDGSSVTTGSIWSFTTAPPVPDDVPPDTTLTATPANPSNSDSAGFEFTGTDNLTAPANLTFECQLDSGGFSSCTSPANFTSLANGSHTFEVRAIDEDNNTDPTPASFTWTINMSPPVADDQNVSTAEDTPLAISLTGSDADEDPLIYTIINPPSHGDLSGSGANWTYTPNADYNGPDSFTFQVDDGEATDTATVSIVVNPVNDAPIAADDNASVAKGEAVTINVLANDDDVDGDDLTVTAVTAGNNGTVTTDDTSVTYTHDGSATTSDSFTYTIDDGNGGFDTATVSITISQAGLVVTIGPPSTLLANGGPVDFSISYSGAGTVNLTGGDITLNATGNATGTVTVLNGTTSNPTIRVSGISGDGTLSISLAAGTASNGSGNTAPAAGPSQSFEVLNTIAYNLAASDADLTEGDSGSQQLTFTVTRSGATNVASQVDFDMTGTATYNSDYENIGGTAGVADIAGTINFAADETIRTITLDVLGDRFDEDDETIQVTLSDGTAPGSVNYAGNPAATTIIDDVTIPLSSGSACTVTSSATILNAGWNTGVQVTVTGQNDDIDNQPGDRRICTITTGAPFSSDSDYNSLSAVDVDDVLVTVTDDDTAGLIISDIGGDTSEDGGTTTFTVRLDSQPTGEVIIDVTSLNPGEGTISPSPLIFTPDNWAEAQTVTVTGQDDGNTPDGNASYTIRLTVNPDTIDPVYAALEPQEVGMINRDNDVPSLYLPLLFNGFVQAPDLVIESVTATGNSITVVIKNQGSAPVEDAFWVDVYFNPDHTPNLNEPWSKIAQAGAVWGVEGAALPLPANETLTLTLNDSYYVPDASSSLPFPAGAEVYGYVDSINYSTTYGNVEESNESNNRQQGPISTAGQVQPAPTTRSKPSNLEQLPARSG